MREREGERTANENETCWRNVDKTLKRKWYKKKHHEKNVDSSAHAYRESERERVMYTSQYPQHPINDERRNIEETQND